jgi:hypothetical protein
MNIRRYLVVALVSIACVLLLRRLMPPETPPNPPSQPSNATNDVTHLPAYLEAAPKPGSGGQTGATNMLTTSSGNQPAQPAPAADIAETATNPPGGDTNPVSASTLSGQPVKPPWTPPPPGPPPVGLGMTNPVVVPPGNSKLGPESP